MSTQTTVYQFSAEVLLDTFLKSNRNACFVIDNQLSVINFNKAYQQLHETFFAEHPFVGMPVSTIFKQNLFAFLQQAINEMLAYKQDRVYKVSVAINEQNNRYDFELHPLTDVYNNLSGILVQIFETIPTEKPQYAINDSETLFKTLVINSTDAFQVTDLDLKILYISDSVKNVLGFDSEELRHQYFFSLIHPDDHLTISTWLHWLTSSPGTVRSVELRIKNKNKEWVYIEISGNNLIGIDKVNAIVMNYRNIQNRKIAEQALALAEQRMGLLLNNTKESFIVVNSRLRVVTYNKAAQDHSPHFFKQELQSGMSLMELFPDADMGEIILMFEEVFEGREQERETFFIDALGKQHFYQHTFRPLFSETDTVGVFITSTEITDRKNAEIKLKRSEERYKTIIQESFDAMLIKDEENRIKEASPAIERILGYTPEELIGQVCFNFIHKDYSDAITEIITELIQNPEIEKTIDVPLLRKDGRYIWVELKGKNLFHNELINGMIVMMRDISERKEAQDLLTLSEQRFRGLVQSGADMITLIDEEGFVTYTSPSVYSILGNNPQDDIGKNIFKFIHPSDRRKAVAAFEKMLQDGVRQMHFGPYRFPNQNKEYRWLETVVTNLYDDPSVRGIVLNSRDVTERKKLNEEQKALTDELVKNNQDLQQFSFITSHNLRAPVANLISLLDLFNREDFNDPFNKTLVEKFEEATNQLNTTLNDLLDVLVLKSNNNIETEQLSITKTINTVTKNIAATIKSNNAIIHTDFKEVDLVAYNKIHLESICQNFITNAIKYRKPEVEPIIHIASSKVENWIVLSFADNGLGIDLNRYKDRLFGLYQRFHAGKEGKGLGLYMVNAQVKALGGKIEVESEPGVGTIFKVYMKQSDGKL